MAPFHICFIFVLFITGSFSFVFKPSSLLKRRHVTSGTGLNGMTPQDFFFGMFIEVDKVPYKLNEYTHVRPGGGAGFTRAKVTNLLTGSINERTFRQAEPIFEADVEVKEMKFVKKEGDILTFANEDDEEIEINNKKNLICKKPLFLVEDMDCMITVYKEKPIIVDIPSNYVYEIKEVVFNSGSSKHVALNGGAEITVPSHLEVGLKVTVNTDSGKYMSKAY